jgi:hypothetical protein
MDESGSQEIRKKFVVGSGPQELLSIPETCSHDVQSALLGDSDFGVGFAAMKPLRIDLLRDAVAEGRIQWRKHVLQKLAKRGFSKMQFAKFCLMANASAITRGIAPFRARCS